MRSLFLTPSSLHFPLTRSFDKIDSRPNVNTPAMGMRFLGRSIFAPRGLIRNNHIELLAIKAQNNITIRRSRQLFVDCAPPKYPLPLTNDILSLSILVLGENEVLFIGFLNRTYHISNFVARRGESPMTMSGAQDSS